jgi:hypothetical protein
LHGERRKFLRDPWSRARLKLYVSGVELAPRGSFRDRALVNYEVGERRVSLLQTKISALAGIATASQSGSKSLVKEITDTLREYSEALYSLEGTKGEEEYALNREYEQVMSMKISLVKTESGLKLV